MNEHLARFPELRSVILQTELPPLQAEGNVYLDLLESIVSQQISGKAAKAIFGRFCGLFPDSGPLPEALRQSSPQMLRTAGLSAQKAGYLLNIAQFFYEKKINNDIFQKMSDEEILELLTQIKGVGRWTVQMILIFSLGRPDILPVDDLGIQQAFSKLYQIDLPQTALKKEMVKLAEPWRPHRSEACRYLWIWNHATKKK